MSVENYGYIPVDTPEKRKQMSPRQWNDEYFSAERKWVQCGYIGHFSVGEFYRRPVPIPENWELAGLDEVPNTAFKFTIDGINWRYFVGINEKKVEWWAGKAGGIIAIIRPKAKAADDGWVKVTPESLPKTRIPIWIINQGGSFCTLLQFGTHYATYEEVVKQYSHWQYAVIPKPPQPELSDAEKCAEEARAYFACDITATDKDFISFALNWAKTNLQPQPKPTNHENR